MLLNFAGGFHICVFARKASKDSKGQLMPTAEVVDILEVVCKSEFAGWALVFAIGFCHELPAGVGCIWKMVN